MGIFAQAGIAARFRNLYFAGLCVSLGTGLLLGSPRPVRAADDTAKLSAEVDAFVAEKEKALDAVHTAMLKAIKGVEKDARSSDLDPDAKRLVIERIKAAYAHCESTKELPASEELIGVAIDFAGKHQKIIDAIETKRKKLVEKTIHEDNPAIGMKLDELEERVTSLMGGRVDFSAGANWRGRFVGRKGDAIPCHIKIQEVSGTVFRGTLHQDQDGAVMRMQGTRDGHKFTLKTTGMLKGEFRAFQMQGCVVGPRIVAKLSGKTKNNKPANGWVTMTQR